MTATLADFRARFPEYAGLADGTVEFWLTNSDTMLNEANWNDCYDQAVLLYTAHTITLSQARVANMSTGAGGSVIVQGGSGAINSASVNGVSASYLNHESATSGTVTDAWFNQTPYGQEYLALRDVCISGGILAGTPPSRLLDGAGR